MRLLQFHEYLALLDGDAKVISPSPGDSRSAGWLEAAREIWPSLGLDAWQARPRRVDTITRCVTGGELLVHVTADWKDCFLILVVPPEQERPSSHILFDIGAEYSQTYFNCPAVGLDAPVEREMIADVIPRLGREADPFAILDKGEGTYMQVYAEGRRYSVEHQLVTMACHYQLRSTVSASAAVELMTSYAFGKNEWARRRSWKLQKL